MPRALFTLLLCTAFSPIACTSVALQRWQPTDQEKAQLNRFSPGHTFFYDQSYSLPLTQERTPHYAIVSQASEELGPPFLCLWDGKEAFKQVPFSIGLVGSRVEAIESVTFIDENADNLPDVAVVARARGELDSNEGNVFRFGQVFNQLYGGLVGNAESFHHELESVAEYPLKLSNAPSELDAVGLFSGMDYQAGLQKLAQTGWIASASYDCGNGIMAVCSFSATKNERDLTVTVREDASCPSGTCIEFGSFSDE
jgi:hypothetical protein